MSARYYDALTSRFISPDPLLNPADPKTLDAFRYADNNPVTYTDATGLAPNCPSYLSESQMTACQAYANSPVNYFTGAPTTGQQAPGTTHVVNPQPSPSAGYGFPLTGVIVGGAAGGGPLSTVLAGLGTTTLDLNNRGVTQGTIDALNSQGVGPGIDFSKWWKDHGDVVLLVTGIVVGVACVAASIAFDFGSTAVLCFGLASAINGISVSDNIANRGMSVGDAVTLGVANEALLGMGFAGSTALARVPLSAGTRASQAALNAMAPYVLFQTPVDALNVSAVASGWPPGGSAPAALPVALPPPSRPWNGQRAAMVSLDGYSCPAVG